MYQPQRKLATSPGRRLHRRQGSTNTRARMSPFETSTCQSQNNAPNLCAARNGPPLLGRNWLQQIKLDCRLQYAAFGICSKHRHDQHEAFRATKPAEPLLGRVQGRAGHHSSGNNLTSLPDDFGEDYPALKFLDLGSNSLTTVSRASLAPLLDAPIEAVELGGNPLVCDCSVEHLRTFPAELLSADCQAPEALRRRNVHDLSDEDLQCAA